MEGEEGGAHMKMKSKVNEINKPNMDCWLLIAPEANGSFFGNSLFGHRGMGRKSKPSSCSFHHVISESQTHDTQPIRKQVNF